MSVKTPAGVSVTLFLRMLASASVLVYLLRGGVVPASVEVRLDMIFPYLWENSNLYIENQKSNL